MVDKVANIVYITYIRSPIGIVLTIEINRGQVDQAYDSAISV